MLQNYNKAKNSLVSFDFILSIENDTVYNLKYM